MVVNKKLIMCQLSYCFKILLSKDYITIQYSSLFLVIGETAYQPIITGKWVLKKCIGVPNKVMKYDCGATRDKNVIRTHSLGYKLGYHEATV